MPSDSKILEVYQAGRLTVVGFGGHDVLDCVNIADCRDELTTLIAEHSCQSLAFDLTGVKLLPSGLLGLLASLRNLGVQVMIYNPSRDIREVLEITNLDQLIEIHEVKV